MMNCKKLMALGISCLTLCSNVAFAADNSSVTTKQSPLQNSIQDSVSYAPIIGKVSTVNQGQKFEIILQENASTGYTWNYKTDDKSIQLVSVNNKSLANDKKLVGAPTNKIWTFKAVKKGKYKITFTYARSWEKGKAPAKTEEYCVTIK